MKRGNSFQETYESILFWKLFLNNVQNTEQMQHAFGLLAMTIIANYCWKNTRERLLESDIHFQLVLGGLTVFASSLILMKPGRAKCIEVNYSICACAVGSIKNLTNSYFWKEVFAFNLSLFLYYTYLCILFCFAVLLVHLTLKSVCNRCWLVLMWTYWRPSCMYFL